MCCFILKNLINKDIEVYCGSGSDVYFGLAREVNDGFLTLEKDGRNIFVCVEKIQSICLAEKK
ncbi:MAG: MM0924 family protein [Cyanobacteriota bacterium]